jgi:Cellulase (glycosyl hydrolase family 5)
MALRCLLPVLTLAAFFAHAEALRNAYPIDTFESSESLAHWHVSGSASLRLGTGYQGSGAVLTYRTDLRSPVTITWTPNSPIPKVQNSILSLWVRSSEDVDVSLNLTEGGGNIRTLPVKPSLEHSEDGEWRYVAGVVKKRITALAIIVRSRNNAPVQGELSFDEIFLSSGKNLLRLDPEQRIDAPSKLKTLPVMGVNIHLLRDEPSVDLAHAAGFSFVRMDLLWKNVERRGRFRFFAYDALLRGLEARGMGVLWILDYGHADHDGGVPRNPEDIAAFCRFAEAVAAHFRGRNVRYEIWNEPNNPQFWAPSPNPAEYAALLKETLTAMRRADPAAVISSGGISNLDLPYLSRALDRSFAPILSAVSVHPYPRTRPEAIVPAYAAMGRWMRTELGDTTELWDSEWGYSSALPGANSALNGKSDRDRTTQAMLAAREILTVWSLGFSLGVWYDLRDDGTDGRNPEQNYGLLDSEGDEKPAMRAVRHLMNSALTRKFSGLLPQPPPGLHVMRFDGSRDRLLVVWTDVPDEKTTFECVRKDLVSVTDMLGEAMEVKSGSKSYVRIRIAEKAGPVYVLFRTGSPQ